MELITKKGDIKTSSKKETLLILSLNKNEEIIQFNTECEELSGYHRDEVLHKKISDLLIPPNHHDSWKKLFNSFINDHRVSNFSIPLKTQSKRELVISWSGFTVDDPNGQLKTICLIGEFHSKFDSTKDSFKTSKTIPPKQQKPTLDSDSREQSNNAREESMAFTLKNKRVVFGKKRSFGSSRSRYRNTHRLLETNEKGPQGDNRFEDWDAMDKSIAKLSKKYSTLHTKLRELEKKDRKLERKNRQLEKKLKRMKTQYAQRAKHQKTTTQKRDTKEKESDYRSPSKQGGGIVFDPFGLKRKERDFDRRMHALDERKKKMAAIETQYAQDRKNLDAKIKEFSQWRQKLEQLEAEIERRRSDLVEEEKAFRARVLGTSHGGVLHIDKPGSSLTPDKDYVQTPAGDQEIFEQIPQSAAILQRGILKKINNSFSQLIGYTVDEIVDKSFFDFIAPEGLAEIEQYYYHRLKGEPSNSTYKTVLFTKNNDKVVVETTIKPTIYAGDKAEIVIFQQVETK